MLAHDIHHRGVGLFARPVTLPLQHHLLPGHRDHARLDHALHREVVGFFGGAAGGVRHHINFVVAFQHRAQGKAVVAHFGPQTGDNHFLLAVGLQRVTHFLVVPGVHGGTLQNVLAREHVQQFRIGIAGEAFSLNGGDDGWDVEHLSRFRQRHGVVFQHLAVNRLHAERHLWLVIDEDDLTVGRG